MLEKTYCPKKAEESFQDLWEQCEHRRAGVSLSKEPYTIMMPPPNVTGALHLGHALTYTLQDILIRTKRMQGFDVLWQPGLDHAGIATQMVVEKQLLKKNIDPRSLSDDDFLGEVWKWKEESGGGILDQLKRLGASADWERSRFTMDEGMSKAVRTVFIELYNQGLIYKDKRLVNWDPHLKTALSDIEVEQREVKGHLWYIRYALEGDCGKTLVVATSRPETLFGDTAIAVHPEDSRYRNLIGQNVIHPLLKKAIPIIGDTYCDPEKGTGAVKITPAHDFNDFEVGVRANLDQISIFTPDGKLTDTVLEAFRGLDRFKAREVVIDVLSQNGFLEKVEEIVHAVPFGDRSGVVVEPRLTDQWYLKTEELSKKAIKAVEEGLTEFVPSQWAETYYRWMQNIQPWCISRQIRWGHRIPAWYGPDGTIFVAHTYEEAQEQANRVYPNKTMLKEETDVLDTWFSSALWPFSTLGWPVQTPELARYYPTDVLVTGFDIIFFWVARMMMMGLHFTNEVPFKQVYINAIVRDEKGQKMSKSKGNVLDPVVLMDKYGADALRFTLTLFSVQGRDVKISDQRVENSRNFITKIWNLARFLELNQSVNDESFDPYQVSHPLCRWLVEETRILVHLVTEGLKSYKFNEVALALYHSIKHIFCDWGVEFAKCDFQGGDVSVQGELKKTLGWSFTILLKIMHPIMPFLSEELWKHNLESKMVSCRTLLMESEWPELREFQKGADAKVEFDHIKNLIGDIRAIRAILRISPKEKITLYVEENTAHFEEKYAPYASYIEALGRLGRVNLQAQKPNDSSVRFLFDKMILALDFGNTVDFVAQRDRLEKEYQKVKQDLESVMTRLNNKEFLERAPAEIVDELMSRKESLTEDLKKREILLK